MKRQLLRTNTFIHFAKRIIRRNPALATDIQSALELLESNSFHPLLKTHKRRRAPENLSACLDRLLLQFSSDASRMIFADNEQGAVLTETVLF